MAYNIHRSRVFRKKLKQGKTRCPYCGTEMFFHGLEFWDRFADRFEDTHGKPSSQWPEEAHAYKASIDHLMPRSRGGTDHFRNMTIMCNGCNLDKGNMTPPEWIAKRKNEGRPLTEKTEKYLLQRWRPAHKAYERERREYDTRKNTPVRKARRQD